MASPKRAGQPKTPTYRQTAWKRLHGSLRQLQQPQIFVVLRRNRGLKVAPPHSGDVRPRMSGALRGKIHMADDFDELPPDVLAAMEGRYE